MKTVWSLLAVGVFTTISLTAPAGDWPQWRGPNRDAKVTGFKAPKTWPKELTQEVEGQGRRRRRHARPGRRQAVRLRPAGAATKSSAASTPPTGKELWQDKYDAATGRDRGRRPVRGPAQLAGRGRRQGRDARRARHPLLLRRRHWQEAVAQG